MDSNHFSKTLSDEEEDDLLQESAYTGADICGKVLNFPKISCTNNRRDWLVWLLAQSPPEDEYSAKTLDAYYSTRKCLYSMVLPCRGDMAGWTAFTNSNDR